MTKVHRVQTTGRDWIDKHNFKKKSSKT